MSRGTCKIGPQKVTIQHV